MKQSAHAVEDYLKTIYAHTEWQDEPILPSALAARLGLAPSTVTEMVKKLAASGLVTHVPYGAVTLTDEGRARAVAVVRRHRLVETWLVRDMGYGWDAVHDEAEILEHAISDRLLDAISAKLGHPDRDPHGDPIPAADGTVRREPAVLLERTAPGHHGTVLRISDRDPALLRTLEASGVTVGAPITVWSARPLVVSPGKPSGADAVAPVEAGAEITLPADAASAIWLSE
ncbi:manganese-binding transcriptional regulator MntR [Okibacterium endophyticum]